MSNKAIRLVTPDDAAAILAIYKPYIENTTITFEYEVPSEAAFRERIVGTLSQYPYIVYTMDEQIIGYAYASRHRERAAYGWNVELSIYLDQTQVSKGVGRKLYTTLIKILEAQNIYNIYGCITPPNPKSEQLHKSLGFTQCGYFAKTGYKFGEWKDVVWFEKCIGDRTVEPKPFRPIGELSGKELQIIIENELKTE